MEERICNRELLCLLRIQAPPLSANILLVTLYLEEERGGGDGGGKECGDEGRDMRKSWRRKQLIRKKRRMWRSNRRR